MKKGFSLVLVASLCLCFFGCGDKFKTEVLGGSDVYQGGAVAPNLKHYALVTENKVVIFKKGLMGNKEIQRIGIWIARDVKFVDNNTIAILGEDEALRFYSLKGEKITTVALPGATFIKVSPVDKIIVADKSEKDFYILAGGALKVYKTFSEKRLRGFSFSRDGIYLLGWTEDAMGILNIPERRWIKFSNSPWIRFADWGVDYNFVTLDNQGNIRGYNYGLSLDFTIKSTSTRTIEEKEAVSYSPDGRYLCVAGDRVIEIVSPISGEVLEAQNMGNYSITGTFWAQSGKIYSLETAYW
ncbi:MAG: WD40 repeat domain-containing protein [Candidatus Gribaldobacteria bacterium]|nr:WD40 repeat domain-containing protein [Candidatus Gribaldobacteria bacterium]